MSATGAETQLPFFEALREGWTEDKDEHVAIPSFDGIGDHLWVYHRRTL